ncbi:MAG: hypothetical protein ABIO60_10350 [Aquaticitalea sp.]
MNVSRTISFLFIVIGGIIAIYAQSGTNQNQYVLVVGIFVLMMGVYRISRNIPSKQDDETSKDNDQGF